MNQQDILTKLHDLKGNIQHALAKARSDKAETDGDDEGGFEAANGEDNSLDDLSLTVNREEDPSVTYYTTENSELARDAEKTTPKGIDSFGEKGALSFEQVVERQTNREWTQKSDLSERYSTSGMDLDDL